MKLIVDQYYYMLSDAVSHFKKQGKLIIYARAGDKVKLKSDLGNVVILEKHDKTRFPTETKNIVEIKNLFSK